MKPQAPPERGDLLRVDWIDIFEDAVGNPETAALARRTSYGLFWAFTEDRGIPTLVTTTTVDCGKDGQSQAGYCIYPTSCVVRLSIVRRSRRSRKPKAQ